MPQRKSQPYETAGLSPRQFDKVFNQIKREQARNRQDARHTLRPSAMRGATDLELLLLGKRPDGRPFTADDLQEFSERAKKHKKSFKNKEKGVTYHQLISASLDIDVKRANNRSHDGWGIRTANLVKVQGSKVTFKTDASANSPHKHHRVVIRMEEWDDLLTTPPHMGKNVYVRAAAMAAAGRLSFDCDCGRHQYYYRYMATIGNYALTPKEFSYPKVRNPDTVGACCKHVIKALTKLQSPTIHKILARQMEQQADKIAFGDDRTHTHFLSKDEQATEKTARKSITDQDQVKQQYARYQRAQKAWKRQQQSRSAEDIATIEELKAQLKRERSKNKKLVDRIDRQQRKNPPASKAPKKPPASKSRTGPDAAQKQLQKMADKIKRNQLKMELKATFNGIRLAGVEVPKDRVYQDFAKRHKLSVKEVKALDE